MHLRDESVRCLRDEGDWTIAPIRSYGPNWPLQRQKARARDGFRCRNCGRPEAMDREHDVHHLRPFRLFDYRLGENATYLLANRLSNLVTLCPDCHPKVEAVHAVQGTLEGLAHLMHALAPLYLMCDPYDLRVISDLDFRHTRAPTVVAYDVAPGGVGFSEMLYQVHSELLHACLDWIGSCPCEEGCPACVGAPPNVGAGAKQRVQRLLDLVVNSEGG
jgi:DEAD/DEAH box helicase domain-containing protein